jgi:hypothetical protein
MLFAWVFNKLKFFYIILMSLKIVLWIEVKNYTNLLFLLNLEICTFGFFYR